MAAEVRAARVLGLTATTSAEGATEIVAHYGIAPAAVVRTPFRRPNLSTAVIELPPAAPWLPGHREAAEQLMRREQRLKDLLCDYDRGPTLVYVNTRSRAEWLATQLDRADLPVLAYHAGLPSVIRSKVQDRVHNTVNGIVVCTCAFGMSLDKKDVRVRTGGSQVNGAVGTRIGGRVRRSGRALGGGV